MTQQQPPGGPQYGQQQPGQPQQQQQAQQQQQYQQAQQQQYQQQAQQAQAQPQAHVPQTALANTAGHDAEAMASLGPKGQILLNEVNLLPGEKIQYAIMGDGYFLGANPLLKAIAVMQAMLTTLTGGHIRVFLLVTNRRILMLQSTQMWCGWARTKNVNAIALASLIECGSGKETQFCCIHSRLVHIETKTQKHQLVIKKLGDPEIRDFVANLSAVLVSNVDAKTAS